MLQLSRIALLLLVMVATGCAVVQALSGLSWRRPEGLGFGFAAGMGINTVALFLLSAAGIRLGYAMNLAALSVIGIGAWGLARRLPGTPAGNEEARGQSSESRTSVVLSVALFLAISLLVWRVIFENLSTPYVNWDEFSYWGLAAKSIYLRHSVDLRGAILGASWKTPPMAPLGGASMAFAVGIFAENYTKLASTLFLLPALLILFGMARRARLTTPESLLFLMLFMTSGRTLVFISSGIFSDLPFAVFLLGGVSAYLLSRQTRRPAGTLVLAGLMFGMAAWSRAGGAQFVLASITLMMAADFKSVRQFGLKAILGMISVTLAIPLGWQVFLRLHPWSGGVPQDTGMVAHVSVWQRVLAATPQMLNQMTGWYVWSGFWIIAIVSAVVSAIWFRTERAPRSLIAIIGANIIFYWLAYLLVFPSDEALRAQSFNRYVAHALPVATLLVMYCYCAVSARWKGTDPNDWVGTNRVDAIP